MSLLKGIRKFLSGQTALVILSLASGFATPAASQGDPLFDPDRGVLSFAKVIDNAARSVVQILAIQTPQSREGQPFVSGPGSGVIYDSADGYIFTNEHVVAGADAFTVELADGRRLEAELVGADQVTNISVLRVSEGGLPAIPVASSDELLVGDVVFAIGYPYGLQQTVTMGIVSGIERRIGMSELEDYIQTDAAINSGNSGGPLIDSRGSLIGVNTLNYGPAEGNVGLGFAVPSRIALSIAAQIVKFGSIQRDSIGASLSPLDPAMAETLGLPAQSGLVVDRVFEGSTAQTAGLQVGDLVVSVDGRKIDDVVEFRATIDVLAPGTSVKLGIDRSGNSSLISVTLEPQRGADVMIGRDGSSARVFGAAMRGPSREDWIPPGPPGAAVVMGQTPWSAAAKAGLRSGDLIVFFEDEPVESAIDLAKKTTGGPPPWHLGVIRPGVAMLKSIRVEE